MAPPQRANPLSPEQMNALVEQQVVNTRILALKHAQKLARLRSISYNGIEGERTTVDKLLEDAAKVAGYLVEGLDGLKKKSGLVITSQMPPPGAGFKVGE
jgi:hypothetical protein